MILWHHINGGTALMLFSDSRRRPQYVRCTYLASNLCEIALHRHQIWQVRQMNIPSSLRPQVARGFTRLPLITALSPLPLFKKRPGQYQTVCLVGQSTKNMKL